MCWALFCGSDATASSLWWLPVLFKNSSKWSIMLNVFLIRSFGAFFHTYIYLYSRSPGLDRPRDKIYPGERSRINKLDLKGFAEGPRGIGWEMGRASRKSFVSHWSHDVAVQRESRVTTRLRFRMNSWGLRGGWKKVNETLQHQARTELLLLLLLLDVDTGGIPLSARRWGGRVDWRRSTDQVVGSSAVWHRCSDWSADGWVVGPAVRERERHSTMSRRKQAKPRPVKSRWFRHSFCFFCVTLGGEWATEMSARWSTATPDDEGDRRSLLASATSTQRCGRSPGDSPTLFVAEKDFFLSFELDYFCWLSWACIRIEVVYFFNRLMSYESFSFL